MPLIMDNPNTELMSALATLLEAGKYSDLKIVCNSREYAVHRAIICSRSGFFDGACRNPFKESETGVIDLSEDDEEAVEHMIHYFYHLDYLSKPISRRTSQRSSRSRPASPTSPTPPRRQRPGKLNLALVEDPLLAQAAATAVNPLTPPDETERSLGSQEKTAHSDCDETEEYGESLENQAQDGDADPGQPHLVSHAKVYALAEKYRIAGLKTLARRKFGAQLNRHWAHESLPDAIEEVYDSTVDTDRGLRDIVIQAFRSHPDLARRKDIEAVVKVTPQLAWELYKVASGMPVS